MRSDRLDDARRLLAAHRGPEAAADLLYAGWYHATGTRMHSYPTQSAYLAVILDPARFEPGWTVTRAGLPGQAGAVEIARDGRRRIAAPPLVAPADDAALIFEVGTPVVAFPLEPAESGGFWHVASLVWQAAGPPEPRRRLYFALREGRERAFARHFTALADPAASWSLKLLTGICPAGRRDPAVAYLPATLSLETGWVADILAAAGPLVGDDPPPGTKPIAPGIASAPDRELARSFGQLLCETLADLAVDPADAHTWTEAAHSALARLAEESQ